MLQNVERKINWVAWRRRINHSSKGQDLENGSKDKNEENTIKPGWRSRSWRERDDHLIPPTAIAPGKRKRQKDADKKQG